MKIYDPQWGTTTQIEGAEGEEDGDYYEGPEISHDVSTLTAQTKGALSNIGPGIKSGGVVTAGSGLSVNISPLVGIALSSAYGLVALRTPSSVNRAVLPPSSTFTLFAAIQVIEDGNDTRESRLPGFLVDDGPTMDGAEPLATITTDGGGVTSIVDARRIIDGSHYKNQGNYNNAVSYSTNDVTTDAGIKYASLQNNNLNHTPASSPAWWEVFAGGGLSSIQVQQGDDTAETGIDTVQFANARVTKTGTTAKAETTVFVEDEAELASIISTLPDGMRAVILNPTEESEPPFNQITVTADHTSDGTEDRIDMWSATTHTVTLPTATEAMWKQSRMTFPNIGEVGTDADWTIEIEAGAAFTNGDTSVTVPPGQSLEAYVTKRGTDYLWVKI